MEEKGQRRGGGGWERGELGVRTGVSTALGGAPLNGGGTSEQEEHVGQGAP